MLLRASSNSDTIGWEFIVIAKAIGIAAQTLMLTAKSMGYDSCPMIGFDPGKVAEIIDLPKNHVIGMMLTVGKALKDANVRSGQLPFDEVVFRNGFSR